MQHVLNGPFVHVGEYVVDRHGQAGTKGKVQTIIGGGCLQFKIEGPTDLLAQGHTPRAVNPGPKRRMYHQLHAAALIEEPLGHNLGLGRDNSQDSLTFFKISNQLSAGFFVNS